MNTRTTSRLAAVAGPALALAVLLGACGGEDSSAASRPTVTLEGGETSYATIAPATTTTVAPEVAAATGPTFDYEVQAGDYGIKVAEDFSISLGELEAANGWSSAGDEFPGPGTIIQIPESATVPTEDDDETADTEPETGETVPDPGTGCEAGSYTIEEGDTSRVKVAEKFDVTVEAMDAANANTEGYSSFFPGLEIVIPPKADC